MKNFCKSNKGMTLVEIILALLLLGIVIVPIGRFFIDSFKFQDRNNQIAEINAIASYIVEALKNGQAEELLNGGDFGLDEIYEKIGSREDKGASLGTQKTNYTVNIESTKLEDDIVLEENLLDFPSTYEGTIEIDWEENSYTGDMDITLQENMIIINEGYGENNLIVRNNSETFIEIYVKNLCEDRIKIYKDNSITLNILEGNIRQINLTDDIQQSQKYEFYKVKITITDEDDSSISTTIETTIKN